MAGSHLLLSEITHSTPRLIRIWFPHFTGWPDGPSDGLWDKRGARLFTKVILLLPAHNRQLTAPSPRAVLLHLVMQLKQVLESGSHVTGLSRKGSFMKISRQKSQKTLLLVTIIQWHCWVEMVHKKTLGKVLKPTSAILRSFGPDFLVVIYYTHTSPNEMQIFLANPLIFEQNSPQNSRNWMRSHSRTWLLLMVSLAYWPWTWLGHVEWRPRFRFNNPATPWYLDGINVSFLWRRVHFDIKFRINVELLQFHGVVEVCNRQSSRPSGFTQL